MENTVAIWAEGLTKKFGDFVAVSGIDLEIPKGKVFALLGPNGSGKTTSVRMLAALLWPDGGDAVVAGYSVVKQPLQVKAKIGILPDASALFSRITLWEHLIMEGLVRGLTRPETESRATDLLRYMDLWERRHAFADEGSMGMRKKLGIALALIHAPEIVILDEPFEGLDPISAAKIRDLLRATVSKRGTTLLITSHLLALLETLVDHIAIISDGEIVSRTTLAEIQESGASLESVYLEAFRDTEHDPEAIAWLV